MWACAVGRHLHQRAWPWLSNELEWRAGLLRSAGLPFRAVAVLASKPFPGIVRTLSAWGVIKSIKACKPLAALEAICSSVAAGTLAYLEVPLCLVVSPPSAPLDSLYPLAPRPSVCHRRRAALRCYSS